jgi:hypothetical protein
MNDLELGIRITSPHHLRELLAFLKTEHIRPDYWCSGLRIEADAEGGRRLIVIGNENVRERIRSRGFDVKIVVDYSKQTDPRDYVSKGNRFEAQLARLRAEK